MRQLVEAVARLRSALHDDASHRRLALAALAFRGLALHQQWGFARPADYVRARLGVPISTWHDWVSAGRLLSVRPELSEAFSFSALALLGRHLTPEEIEPELAGQSVEELRRWIRSRDPTTPDSKHPNDQEFVRLRVRLPRSAAAYCEETLRLARALCGGEISDDDAALAVLAEAGTEIEPAESGSLPAARVARRAGPCTREPTRADGLAALERLRVELPHAATELDQLMRQERCDQDRRRRGIEDRFLELVQLRAPAHMGYRTLEHFFQGALGLPPSSAFAMLRRARQRRRGDPLACANLPIVASMLLEQLRPLGLPPSAMPAWIDEARQISVRQLRRAILWAKSRSRSDQLEWALEDYRPPSQTELQTSERPLHELLAYAEPPDLSLLRLEPMTCLELTLQREHAQLLADLCHGLDPPRQRTPFWWKLLRLFHRARDSWEQNVEPSRHRFAPVLERDHFRCQVPECSSQRSLEVHHLNYRSQGGSDAPDNLITLCAWHHRRGEHGEHLRVRGQVTPERNALFWELGRDTDGQPLLRYRGDRLLPAEAP